MSLNSQSQPDNKSLIRLEYISCPLCDHPSFDIIYKGITSINNCSASSDKSYYPTSSKGNMVNQVVRCKRCRLVYTNPREKQHDIIRKYQHYVDHTYVSEELSRRKNARKIINYVKKEGAQSPGRWLDVGCSVGFCVDELRAAGWDAYGIESSRWASYFARDLLKLNVKTGQVEHLAEYPANYFDVVSMIVVLAHVIEPVKVISEIRRVLKDGGILFIQTPDFGCLMSRIMRSRWKTVKWQMLYFFTLDTLRYLLTKEKFHIISHRKRSLGKEYSLNYILFHLVEKEKVRARIHRLFKTLGSENLHIYLNLYEYLNVIAVKE